MEKLVLKTTGTSNVFSTYLKKWSTMGQSLLLEIDPLNELFVAKAFDENRIVVKMASVSFSDCKYELVSNTMTDDGGRIYLGIFDSLQRLVKIVEQFETSEYTITFEYDKNLDKGGELTCQNVMFAKNGLKIKHRGAITKDFGRLPDETFLKNVFVATDACVTQITPEKAKNIVSISKVANTADKGKLVLVFFVRGGVLYVRDYAGNDFASDPTPFNFETEIGQIADANPSFEGIEIPIDGKCFENSMGNIDENYTVIASKTSGRVMFDCVSSVSKTVISMLKFSKH